MKTKRITEGLAALEVPLDKKVFFNPLMKYNRDITVQVLNSFFTKKFRACDLLSGTGAKGIRIALETSAGTVVLNDKNPSAIKLIQKNVKLNKLRNVEVESKDANVLLSENKYAFDFIDIDPFGSPSHFVDSACRALLPKDSLLAITATDTGALVGSFHDAALRRYGAWLQKTSFYNELGLRVLAGFAVRTAAKYDIGLTPYFSHSNLHYLRVFMRTTRGKGAADTAVKKVKFLLYCPKCEQREYSPLPKDKKCCKQSMLVLGPMWSGKMFELNLFDELDTDLPYYDLHKLEKKTKKKVGKFENLQAQLAKKGYKSSRTHLNAHAIRTNAPYKELIKCLK